jgi:hypothetical protein
MTIMSARRLRGMIAALAAFAVPLVIVLPMFFWMMGDRASLVSFFTISGELRLVSDLDRLTGLLIGLPGDLVLAYGFWRLHRLMRGAEASDMFDEGSVAHLRAFAGALFVSGLLTVLESTVRAALLNPEPRTLTLELSFTALQAKSLLLAGIFYVVAFSLEEARRIQDENNEIV